MRQTTIWDFLPQESSTEAKPTNQRNTMKFDTLEEVFDYIRQHSKESTAEPADNSETQHGLEDCLDCRLAQIEELDTLLLANVNVSILEVINNTLNQEAPIRNEQADTLLKLTQVRTMLLDNN
jgi:hypothetical protein